MNTPRFLTRVAALIAVAVGSLLNTACAAPAEGGNQKPGFTASLDLVKGVCVSYDSREVCYNPLTKQWTVDAVAVKAANAPDGSVILTDSKGGTLVYKNGKVTAPVPGPATTPRPPPPDK